MARARVLVALACLLVICAAVSVGPATAQRTAPPSMTVAPGPTDVARIVHDLAAEAAQRGAQVERRLAQAAAGPTRAPAALNEREAKEIAAGSRKIQSWIAEHPIARVTATFDDAKREWTVFYVAKDAKGTERTEAQAIIADDTGLIKEERVGPQVAWMMARGYPGAFGRAVNRPAIWTILCVVFLLPLLPLREPRRLFAWRTLDLLALLSFSLSLSWFNRGEVFTSVPWQYPPLIYLAARMIWIGLARARHARRPPDGESAPGPRRPAAIGWAPPWLLVTLLVLTLALRFGLNAFDSNVIDVGYAGVIGADRIAHGQTPYGTMPEDCASCDTYGPLNYLAYVPFELAQPWHGKWDSLPAAHGAASLFDLLCLAGMFMLGWRLAGLRLALTLALAWAAFPFTAYVLETNANDSLVAAGLIWAFAVLHRPLARGLLLGLAMSAKFAPAILLLLWARRPFPRPNGRRQLLPFLGGLLIAAAAVGWVLLLDGADGVRAFWSRTIGYQMGRDSPFSLWGQYPGLRPVQIAVMVAVIAGALALARWPRRLDLVSVAAFSGALLIGTQLTLTHWFYLYIPWFLPFVLLAIVPAWPAPTPAATRNPDPSDGHPVSAVPDAPPAVAGA